LLKPQKTGYKTLSTKAPDAFKQAKKAGA